ncbi:MAG: hypothetical protein LKI39_07855 [Bacteroides sp.]|jgi:hypothetical protein|nr:hypothetical protein [Bacteroides sp.]MCI1682456.1 hypothetical protein [Bacteroides sp.]
MDSDSEKNLLLQAKLFLQSLFLIDVIDIDDPKLIEKLSYDRVFAKRTELPKKTWVIYDEDVFISNEIKKVQYALDDIEKFDPLPKYLIYQPFYNAAKGYILYLERKLSSLQNEKVETPDILKKSPGRPPKQKKKFTDFLSCSEEDKKEVIGVMDEQFKTDGPVGIVYTYIALMSKSYFKRPKYKAELWDALKQLLGDISTYSNLNKMLSDKQGDPTAKTTSDIEAVKKKLP